MCLDRYVVTTATMPSVVAHGRAGAPAPTSGPNPHRHVGEAVEKKSSRRGPAYYVRRDVRSSPSASAL